MATNRGANLGKWLHPKKSSGKKAAAKNTPAISVGAFNSGEPKKKLSKSKMAAMPVGA